MRARGRRRLGEAVVVTVALLGAATAATRAIAQAPTPSPEPVTLVPAVSTELLRVEVVVTDGDGRPVRDLKASDFVILEDGDPQTISHFQGASGRPIGTAGARTSAEPAEAAESGAAMLGRHIVIAIDDLHMSPTSLTGSKLALKRFLAEQVTPEDELALVTTSGALGPMQAFTRERAVLRRAVDRLVYSERRGNAGGRATMSEFDAAAIDSGDPLALELAMQEITLKDSIWPAGRAGVGQNPRVRPEAVGMARTILAQALETTNRTLSILETVVRGLSSVPGRKVLVLVSDGFLIGHGGQDPRAFDMRRIFDASARAGASVYALDSNGLAATPSGGDASTTALLDQTRPSQREGYRRGGDIMQRENMRAVAAGTGGFLVHGANDLSEALGRILADSSASYLLAYSPTHTQRNGRFRTIEVRVPGHPDYDVRSRKGYFAPDDREPAGQVATGASVASGGSADEALREQELRSALSSLLPLRGVPVQMAAEFVDVPPGGPQLVVKARIDLAGIPFEAAGERHRNELDMVGVVYDEAGQVVGEVDSYRTDLDLSDTSYEKLLHEGVRYQKSVPVRPGLYQVRLGAREALSGKVGSAFRWVEVPDLSLGSLALSGVFLFAEAEQAPASPDRERAGSLRDVQAERRFRHGDRLYYSLYVYNPARDDGGRTDVVVQAQVWAGGKLQGVSPVDPVGFADRADPPRPVTGRITLEGLADGDYELRVLVVDRKAKVDVSSRVSFVVG